MTDRELWQNALVQIELATSEASFKTWFKGTDILRREVGVVFIAVPSKIIKEWLRDKHHKLVLKTLRDLDPSIRTVEYVVHKNPRPQQRNGGASGTNLYGNNTLPIPDVYIDKRDNLNPKYTFESFVVGPFNQLAHAAAQAVLQRPGLTYNPLFIYGRTGHGKTHLIQAVGNAFKKAHLGKKVFYITADRFINDFVTAIRAGRAAGLKEQYHQYDVLIMDDVQFIAQTDKTQEELFHLFNAFHDNNKQIVFSSDQHPSLMNGFGDRLRGRFAAGMTAEIPEPDLESRVAILRSKLEQYHFSLEDDVVSHVAEQVSGNIRELEGILNSVVCKAQLKGGYISLVEVSSFIKNSNRSQKGVSVADIVRKIAQYYGIDEQSIYEKTRKKEVVKPRQVIMYILREEYNISYPSIGEKLGGRDHTTVIHSCEKIKGEMRTSPVLTQEIDHLKEVIAV